MGKRQARNAGGRRAYLKRFSSAMINTGTSLNKVGMDALYKRKLYEDPFLSTLFPGVKGVPPERFEAQRQMDVHILRQNDFRQWMETFNFINIEDGMKQKLRLYFSGQRFFFIRIRDGEVHRSCVYMDKSIALQNHRLKLISWEPVLNPA